MPIRRAAIPALVIEEADAAGMPRLTFGPAGAKSSSKNWEAAIQMLRQNEQFEKDRKTEA